MFNVVWYLSLKIVEKNTSYLYIFNKQYGCIALPKYALVN